MPVGDIVSGYTFVPAEKNIDQTKLNAIAGQATIAPAFISGQTPASSTGSGDYFVFLQSTGALAKILTQDLAASIGSSSGMTSAITAVRLRSFNAVGNPNFEVDQRNVGNSVVSPAAGTMIIDRWQKSGSGTYAVNVRQNVDTGQPIIIPGTNYRISSKLFQVNLQTTEPSMAAGDFLSIRQTVEGSALRELISDTHSLSLLVSSTVAGLKFGVTLRDAGTAYSLPNLCTIPSANTWTLISLPNLPIWSPSGTFNIVPVQVGYYIDICLASGSTNTAPSNGAWIAGNYVAANGQSNFCASPVNSLFMIGFIQHEPGPVCTQLMDLPFSGSNGNLESCQRYFQKSYDYGTKPGTVTSNGVMAPVVLSAATTGFGPISYKRTMAKDPTITIYSWSTGAAGSLTDSNGTVHASAVASNIGDAGFSGVTFATATSGACAAYIHYTADTGW